MLSIIFIVLAYLCGSLNFAIIFCKLFGLPDPRSQGSGNPGATNVLRFGGKKLALAVIIGDALKGVAPVLIAHSLSIDGIWLSWVALAAVLGHMYPLFFKFQGGKGVATTLGAILALSWPVGLLVILTWLVIAVLFRFSSLASILSVIGLPIYLLFWQQSHYVLPMILLMLIVVFRHRANIKRLLKKEEPKIGKKNKAS